MKNESPTNSEFAARLAQLVKDLRLGMGLSQDAFAERIGIRQQSLGAWEKKRIKTEPKARCLEAIAELKGWTFEELKLYLSHGEISASSRQTPIIPDKVSIEQLKRAIRDLSPDQALEVIEEALPIVRQKCIYFLSEGAKIAFSKGANEVKINELLQAFLQFVSDGELQSLLDGHRLSRARFNELVAGEVPNDDDLMRIGGMLREAKFPDENNMYTSDQLKALRFGRHTNGSGR